MTSRMQEARELLDSLGLHSTPHSLIGLLSECPSCRAGERDPYGMYLPLHVFQRHGDGPTAELQFQCSNGCSKTSINAALRIDWRAEAAKWQDIAIDAYVLGLGYADHVERLRQPTTARLATAA